MTQNVITLQVNPQQVDIILGALAKQPWEVSNGLIQQIVEQARGQVQQEPESKPELLNEE